MKRCLLPALILAALAASAEAEVSVTRSSDGGLELFFQPGTAGVWEPVRSSVASPDLLNADGDLVGDGWPALDLHPVTGRPNAVWSSGGEDREILFSWHDGNRWKPVRNLSAAPGNDELPALASDSFGNRIVTWVRRADGHEWVLVTALSAVDSAQTAVVEASARDGVARRPVLAVHVDDDAYLVYEELSQGSSPTLSLAIDRVELQRDVNGCVADSGERPIDIARSATIPTSAAPHEPLRPQVHVEDGALWVDWNEGGRLVGWVELVGTEFTSPSYLSIQEVGSDRAARDEVRALVLLDP